MLESQQLTARATIADLLTQGVHERELLALVASVANQQRSTRECVDTAPRVYDALPSGLIDVPSAARRYRRSRRTIQSWIRAGRIEEVGRLRAPARGGGYMVVRKAQVEDLIANPPARGRPKVI